MPWFRATSIFFMINASLVAGKRVDVSAHDFKIDESVHKQQHDASTLGSFLDCNKVCWHDEKPEKLDEDASWTECKFAKTWVLGSAWGAGLRSTISESVGHVFNTVGQEWGNQDQSYYGVVKSIVWALPWFCSTMCDVHETEPIQCQDPQGLDLGWPNDLDEVIEKAKDNPELLAVDPSNTLYRDAVKLMQERSLSAEDTVDDVIPILPEKSTASKVLKGVIVEDSSGHVFVVAQVLPRGDGVVVQHADILGDTGGVNKKVVTAEKISGLKVLPATDERVQVYNEQAKKAYMQCRAQYDTSPTKRAEGTNRTCGDLAAKAAEKVAFAARSTKAAQRSAEVRDSCCLKYAANNAIVQNLGTLAVPCVVKCIHGDRKNV